MKIKDVELSKIHDNLWEISPAGGMNVPGRIYISEEMIKNSLQNDEALKQVINVAYLPGIQKYSLAMPDIHWGYGFPIGGVAATDVNDGVISPGGVGYDINCGVRLAVTSVDIAHVQKRIKTLVNNLFNTIPTGVGSSGAIQKLNKNELNKVARSGAQWAVENGFGIDSDIEFTEENGKMINTAPDAVSERAIERGLDQLGTLGSGNHFLEIGVVSEIYDECIASVFGLVKGKMTVLIHTGSRGYGYQICDDYLKLLVKEMNKYKLNLPDKQLACAPIKSDAGSDYLSAMSCAANFAWANRQIIMHQTRNVIISSLGISSSELQFRLVYDVSHNIAKIEEYEINGEKKKVCVHRKGATRAFAPGSPFIPERYKDVGQPVIIPGDMGRYSFICAGTEKAMDETFGSSCHGAGRLHSRNQALKLGKGRNLIEELNKKGIIIQAKGKSTIAEEMPDAYKNVIDVVDVMHNAGIIKRIAKIKPVGVIKG
ncbi:MAG TPA: RtcB family protein [Ignavibacteriaceae bacterium]|nr:RtcB family protein [Ignavibacteriaceae bacterium]